MSLRSSVGRGVRWVGLPVIAATAALGAAALPAQAAPNPAPQSLPGGDGYVVALGDSYISGEGGATSNRGYSDATTSGNWTHYEVAARSTTIGPKNNWGYSGLVYGDKGDWADKNSEETVRFCHRSYWGATNGLSDGGTPLKMLNLACSGATTNSHGGSGQNVKPGIDFNAVGDTFGQAKLLQDAAKTKRVKAVVLSIGGNDAGFADIASSCIQGFALPSFFGGYHCHTNKADTDRVTPEAMTAVKNKIKGAVANVVQAMDAAGYARTDWKLVYQQVPMPVAKTPPFKESGYDRQNKGGCGMYNDDLAWIYNTVFPRLTGAMKGAIEESKQALGDTPVVYVDNTDAFVGHKLCEPGVIDGVWNMKTANGISPDPAHTNTTLTKAYAVGTPAPANAGYNGQKSEWTTPVYALEQINGDADRKQNPLHPNYWGQRALSACNDAALAAGNNKVVVCKQKADKSQDAKGRPAMELTSVSNIVFKTVPGKPTIGTLGSADKALKLSFTPPADLGNPVASKYQYAFAADATNDQWIDVPAGSGTPGNPQQPALLVKGPDVGGFTEFVNGSNYPVFLRAVNDAGPGPVSEGAVGTPAPTPQPPTIDKVTPGKYSAVLDITEGDTGGVGIDAYEYRIVAPESVADDWTTIIGQTSTPLEIDDLPGDIQLSMELRARTSGGVTSAVPFTVTPGPIGSDFTPLDAPMRLVTKDHLKNQTMTYDVATLSGAPVPADVTALAINLTMANPVGPGHAELYPGNAPDQVEHATSVLNWTDGERLANGINVTIDNGKFKLRSVGDAEFSVDVVGYFREHDPAPPSQPAQPSQQTAPKMLATGTFTTLENPVRAFEQVVNPGDGTVGSGVVVDLGKDVKGAPIPSVDMAMVNAVVYNITAANGTAAGHLRVQPYAATPGALTPTSVLNWYGEGDVTANSTVVRPGDEGKVVVYNGSSAPVKVMIDIQGYFVTDGSGLRYYPILFGPRTVDTRVDGTGVVSNPAKELTISNEIDQNGNVYEYDVVPGNAEAIAFTLTEVGGTTRDHFRAYPGGETVPNASLLNWPAAGHNRANSSMMGVDQVDDGLALSLFSPGQGAHAIVDVLGYFAAPQG